VVALRHWADYAVSYWAAAKFLVALAAIDPAAADPQCHTSTETTATAMQGGMTAERGIAGDELHELSLWLMKRQIFVIPPQASEAWVLHNKSQPFVLIVSVIHGCAAGVMVPAAMWRNTIAEFDRESMVA